MELFQTNFTLFLLLTLSSASLRGYNDICSEDSHCESGFCNQKLKSCDCPVYKDRDKGVLESLFYDDELKLCFSKVGQICTLPTVKDHLTSFRCAPESECKASYKQGMSTEYFGRCVCKSTTQPSSDGKRCIPNVEVRTGKAKVLSMDQVRPEGWNKSGGKDVSLCHSHFVIIFGILASILCSSHFRYLT